jgi:exonuclease III
MNLRLSEPSVTQQNLQLLISNLSQLVMCLQETHFTNQKVHVLRTYQAFCKNRAIRERASGGVSIYVKDDILCTKISLETTLEAIAVSLYLPTQKLTVCNVYLPPNATITVLELSMLIEQLPRPFVLLGDFNAHNVIWGSNRTDTRGEMLESLQSSSSQFRSQHKIQRSKWNLFGYRPYPL